MAGRGKGKWIRRDEARWRALLSRFSDSGLSVRAFCRREALSAASLYRWRGRLQRHAGGKDLTVRSQPAFVDLGVLGAQSMRGTAPVELRLELGGGLTLHLVRR